MGTKAHLACILVFLVVICLGAGSAEGQLRAYWPLDESSGTIAHDKVWKDDPSINLDGRFKGLPEWDPDGGRIINGVQSGAIYLHPDERIEVPQADDSSDPANGLLDFDREPFTVAFWMGFLWG